MLKKILTTPPLSSDEDIQMKESKSVTISALIDYLSMPASDEEVFINTSDVLCEVLSSKEGYSIIEKRNVFDRLIEAHGKADDS